MSSNPYLVAVWYLDREIARLDGRAREITDPDQAGVLIQEAAALRQAIRKLEESP